MKKIFNVIGICALMSYLFIFPSCEESYDEDELLRDIDKKRLEMEMKERTIVLEGYTLNLPVRVTQEQIKSSIDDFYNYCIYRFNPSEKDAIKESLFEQTALFSEYGNFDCLGARAEKGHRYGEPLKEFIAESESSITDMKWNFVDPNNVIKEIVFSEDSESSYFTIHNFWCQISEDGIVEAPTLEIFTPITPN